MKNFQAQRSNRRRSGFSLAEMLVVIVIIGLLATIVVPNLFAQLQWARYEIAKTEVKRLDSTASEYAIRNGMRYPESLEELVQKDENGETFLSQTELPTDPWDTEYQYEATGPGSSRPWIASWAADRAPGGEGYNADVENRPAD